MSAAHMWTLWATFVTVNICSAIFQSFLHETFIFPHTLLSSTSCKTAWKWISNIAQGSAATYLRCGRICYTTLVGNLFLVQTVGVGEFWKSVKILRCWWQESGRFSLLAPLCIAYSLAYQWSSCTESLYTALPPDVNICCSEAYAP